jgi:hypothetical protein
MRNTFSAMRRGFVAPIALILAGAVLSACDGGVATSGDSPTTDPNILNSSDALAKKYGTIASVYCADEADNYLRSVAKYTFKWDEIGTFDSKFDRFVEQVASPGVLTEASNKVTLQNGFGAYERVEIRCDFDTQKKKVLAFSVVGH